MTDWKELLSNLVAAINYRTAVLVSHVDNPSGENADERHFADERMWKAVDAAMDALRADKGGKCPECKGSGGYTSYPNFVPFGENKVVAVPCGACSGTGRA